MSTLLPFQMSPEAEAYVRDNLHPEAGKEAALIQTFSFEARDSRGRVIMYFPEEFFSLGYHEPKQRADAQQIEMCGIRVSVIPETLEVLRGRTLTVKRHVYRYGLLRRKKMDFLVAV